MRPPEWAGWCQSEASGPYAIDQADCLYAYNRVEYACRLWLFRRFCGTTDSVWLVCRCPKRVDDSQSCAATCVHRYVSRFRLTAARLNAFRNVEGEQCYRAWWFVSRQGRRTLEGTRIASPVIEMQKDISYKARWASVQNHCLARHRTYAVVLLS